MSEHDIVILGGGHHGLTVGCYLAKAGLDVCVLESLPYVGGGVISPELVAPGFKTDVCSIWHGFIQANPLILADELGLKADFGLKYLTANHQFSVLFPDDAHLDLYRDVEQTVASIAAFSRRDAEAYRTFYQWSAGVLDGVTAGMFNPPPPFGAFVAMLDSDERSRMMLRALMVSALDIVNEWFESEELKVALLKFAGQAGVSPRTKGSGLTLFLLIPLSHKYGGALPEGGSGALSEAMVRCLAHYGATVRTGAQVERVLLDGQRAAGAVLAGGEVVRARRAVVSSLHAKQLPQLVGAEALPPDFVRQLGLLQRSSYGAVSQPLALAKPPCFQAGPEVDEATFVELAPRSLAELLRSFDDFEYGHVRVDQPTIGCQTRLDPSRAPAGKHTVHLFHYAPFALAEGGAAAWEERRQEVGDGILQTLFERTTNLGPEDVLGRMIETPLDLYRRNPAMIDGDYNHLGMFLHQQMGNRYLPGWGYTTPVEGLWMCGPSCHPGGGVTGGGRAAVQPLLAALGIDFREVIGG